MLCCRSKHHRIANLEALKDTLFVDLQSEVSHDASQVSTDKAHHNSCQLPSHRRAKMLALLARHSSHLSIDSDVVCMEYSVHQFLDV